MCEECEQAEPLEAVYRRRANRYGWRPPVATTAPRYDDGNGPGNAAAPQPVRAPTNEAEVDRCA